MDINKLVDDCISAVHEKIKSLNTLNVVIVGKTGVGKSTLINSVFRENLAETGIGRPVTKHMRKISKKGMPINIFDTKGFELGKNAQDEVKEELNKIIEEGVKSKDVNKTIHCIWYCINAASNRIEPEEIAWIKRLTEENKIYQVPIIIVLTQSFSKKHASELKRVIENENLAVVNMIPVLAQDYEIDDEYIVKAYGLDTLISVMVEVLPEELEDTLSNVQKASLELKIKKSQAAVATAAATAAGIGATPIPFADAAVLIPTEITMIASITAFFGFELSKSVLTSLVTSVVGTTGATILGRTVVSNLCKLIPGAGSIAGGVISGATASLMTTALGEAYIGIMIAMFKGEIKEKDLLTKEGKTKLTDLFQENLRRFKIEKNINIK